MSALLRVGGSIDQLEKAFSGIGACPSFVSARGKGIQLSKGNYCGMAIINEVKDFLKEVKEKEEVTYEDVKKIHQEIKKDVPRGTQMNIVSCDENGCSIQLNKKGLSDEELKYIKENGETAFAYTYDKCPQCGEKLEHIGGCIQCMNCAYTKCD